MSGFPVTEPSVEMTMNLPEKKSGLSLPGKPGELLSIFYSLGPLAGCRLISDTLLSVNHYYILGRSLSTPIQYHLPKKPDLPFVPLDERLLDALRKQVVTLDPIDRRELLGRLRFHASGFANCFVMLAGSEIAYMQWIIFPEENEVIRKKYAGRFHPLTERQVMVENVFTFPRFRGRGLLPFGTLQLLDIARQKGYGSCICYIRKDNITSLNEFFKMGFKIIKMVREYKFMGHVWRTL